MSYTPTATVISKSLAGAQDQAFLLGSGVVKRQWNTTLFQTGSFGEAWIGFRMRVHPAYTYSSSAGVSDWYYAGARFAAGLCDTNGPVYGNSGSGVLPKHCLFAITPTIGNSDTWPRYITGSYSYCNTGGQLVSIVSGSMTSSFGTTGNVLTFDPRIRETYILRFTGLTGSVVNPNWGTSSLTILSQNTTLLGQSTDFTSSALVAEMMKQTNWAGLVSRFPAYTQQTVQGTNVVINQSANGYFNGIFFSWNRSFDLLEISDVVVRIL